MSEDCKDSPIWIDVIAYIGGIMMAVAPWQQLWKVYRKKSSKDISLKTYLYIGVGISMSITYTSYNLILPLLIPTSIEMLGWLMLIFIKLCWFKEKNFRREYNEKDIEIVEQRPKSVMSNNVSNNLSDSSARDLNNNSPSPDTIDQFIRHNFEFINNGVREETYV